jgi:hypothetical protein
MVAPILTQEFFPSNDNVSYILTKIKILLEPILRKGSNEICIINIVTRNMKLI